MLDDHFTGTDLDRSVWLPHYLPAWSSRAASAASYEVAASRLRRPVRQLLRRALSGRAAAHRTTVGP